jgi:hypothetical protein
VPKVNFIVPPVDAEWLPETIDAVAGNTLPDANFTLNFSENINVERYVYCATSWDPDGDPIVDAEVEFVSKPVGSTATLVDYYTLNGVVMGWRYTGDVAGTYVRRVRVQDDGGAGRGVTSPTPLWSDWVERTDTFVDPQTPADPHDFTQSVIDLALYEVKGVSSSVNVTAQSFNYEPGTGKTDWYDQTHTVAAACAMQYLAVVAHDDPTKTGTPRNTSGVAQGSELALTTQVLRCVRHFLSPTTIVTGQYRGGEPPIFGDYGWTAPMAASTLVLAKDTSEVWDALTADEQERADWLMKTFAVVGNLMHNASHFSRLNVPLWRSGNHLPNQRGFPAVMSYAYIYFGGASAVNAILAAFNFDEYISRFTAYGWLKNKSLWTQNASTRALMEGTLLSYTATSGSASGQSITVTSQGVRRAFTFDGVTVNLVTTQRDTTPNNPVAYTPFDIFNREEAGFMYGSTVVNESIVTMQNPVCAGHNGWLYDASAPGTIGTSDYTDDTGMCYELNADDGRSSFHYACAGNRPAIAHYTTLREMGEWPNTAAGDTAALIVWTANNHLYHEAGPMGWMGADGQGRCGVVNGEATELNWRSGYRYGRDLFDVIYLAEAGNP